MIRPRLAGFEVAGDSEIISDGTLSEKRDLALQIFGSNLVLYHKKARGFAVKLRSFVAEENLSCGMVPRSGLEPETN